MNKKSVKVITKKINKNGKKTTKKIKKTVNRKIKKYAIADV